MGKSFRLFKSQQLPYKNREMNTTWFLRFHPAITIYKLDRKHLSHIMSHSKSKIKSSFKNQFNYCFLSESFLSNNVSTFSLLLATSAIAACYSFCIFQPLSWWPEVFLKSLLMLSKISLRKEMLLYTSLHNSTISNI